MNFLKDFGKKVDSLFDSEQGPRASSRTSARSEMGASSDQLGGSPGDMPDSKEIDRQLEEMLVQQGQKPAQRVQILALPDDKKWTMVTLFQRQSKSTESADTWVSKIHVEPSADNLEKLSVIMRTGVVSFVSDFIAAGGVVALCNILELWEYKPSKSSEDLGVIMQLLRCIRAVMSVEAGVQAVAGGQAAIHLLRASDDEPSASDVERWQKGALSQLALVVEPSSRDGHQACEVRAHREAHMHACAAPSYSCMHRHGAAMGTRRAMREVSHS